MSNMSWKDIIKEDVFEEHEKKFKKLLDDGNKWLDHTIDSLTEIKKIINSEEGEVTEKYLKEILNISSIAERMVDDAFSEKYPRGDYDSAYDTDFNQRMYEQRRM